MTSTLPNLCKPSATAAGSKSISLAGVTPAGAAPAPAGGFEELLPAAKTAAAQKPVEPSTASASNIHAVRVAEAGDIAALVAADDASADEAMPVSRDTLEQAAAFASVLIQALLPEATVPVLPEAEAPAVMPAGGDAAAQPGVSNLEGALSGVPASGNQAGKPVPEGAEGFQVACASDGAVEIKLDLTGAKTDAKVAAESAVAGTMIEVTAELELPGQAVMRLEASGSLPLDQSSRAIFAARKEVAETMNDSLQSAGQLNFESVVGKPVKKDAPASGIPVAKTGAPMSTATLEETRAPGSADISSPVHAHGQFSVAWPAADKLGEAVVTSADENFAHRAVSAVTSLVDTQFSVSMQKSGSVQLKLKFGGEDLSVRVELRDGVVHTNFRTDSAELRAALTQEMQNVANQSPEQLRRYVAPIFSPGSPSDSSGGSYSESGRQPATQQDLSQHQQRQARQLNDEAPAFARHSLVRGSFSPEPAAPRVAVHLPTSIRLSALA